MIEDEEIRNAVHFHVSPEQRFKEVKDLIVRAKKEERKKILGECNELKEAWEYLNKASIRMKMLIATQFCFPGPHPEPESEEKKNDRETKV